MTGRAGLTGTNWLLVRFWDGDREVDATEADAGLLVDGTGRVSGRGGNSFGAVVVVEPGHLRVRERAGHLALFHGLRGEVDRVIGRVLVGRPAWSVVDGVLRVEHPDVGMEFRARPPDPDEPLLLDHAYYLHGGPRRRA